MKNTFIISLIIIFGLIPQTAVANHGPGTTGGGATTQSGETIKEDQFVFSLDETYTNYENVSQAEAEERAGRAGEFDALRDAYLTNIALGYGVTNDFQIEGGIGWYSGRNFIDAHREEPGSHEVTSLRAFNGRHSEEIETSSAIGNPEGLTDLMLRGKYRVMKGEFGHLSVIGGGIFPVGTDNERLSDGDKLEPSSQPGTGRYSALGGLAYSKYLTSHLTFDISTVYTHRFERDDFQVGDRFDNGIALAYRVTDSVKTFPQLSLFTELSHQYIGRDEDEEGRNANSGGNALFIVPGARVSFTENAGLILAPAIPIAQNLNGDQLDTDFKLMSQLFVRF